MITLNEGVGYKISYIQVYIIDHIAHCHAVKAGAKVYRLHSVSSPGWYDENLVLRPEDITLLERRQADNP